MSDLFISYSRKDQPLVRRLHAALLEEKREAWVDWKDIPPTAEWMHEIRASIDHSRGFVFILSPASVGSEVCREELDYAVSQGKRLIPVVAWDVPMAQVSDAVGKIQWIFLRENDDFQQGVQSLIKALDTDLAWLEAHTSLLVRTREWLEKKQDKSILLRGRELLEAEQWLANTAGHKDPSPTPEQMQYVVQSRRAATRRQRTLLSTVVAALLVTIGLAVWALGEQRQAKKNAAEADRQAGIAKTNEGKAKEQEGFAKTNEARAREQEGIAKTNEKFARKEEGIAKEERDLAIERENEARARQLAAQAQFLQASDPSAYEKASLLAAESLKRLPNLEADQVMRHGLRILPSWVAELKWGMSVAVDVNDPWMALADWTPKPAKLTLHVIDLTKRQEVRNYPIHFELEIVAISSDGRIVAAAGEDYGVEVFDQRSGREIHFDCANHGLAFSSWDDYLVMACNDEAVVVATATWENPVRMKADEEIAGIAYRPDQKQVAVITGAADIYVWSVTGAQVAHIPAQEKGASSRWFMCCNGAQIKFSKDGRYLAAFHSSGPARAPGTQLRVIDTSTWKPLSQLGHEDQVTAVDFADGFDVMATGDIAGRVRVWDLRSFSTIAVLAQNAEITSVHIPRKGWDDLELRLVTSTSTDHTARLWDFGDGRELARIGRDAPVLWADRVRDKFAAIDGYGFLEFRETSADESAFRIRASSGHPPTLATCASNDALALAFISGGVILTPEAKQRFSFRIEAMNEPGLAFSPDCRWVVSGADKSLDVRDIKTNIVVHSEKGYYTRRTLTFSSSGRYLVLAASFGGESSELWDMSSWTRIPLDPACKILFNLRLSPDEHYVGYNCGKGYVVKETGTWREVGRSTIPPGEFNFLPHDRMLAAEPEGLHVYDLPGLRPAQTAPLPDAKAHWQVVVSPNGALLAAIATSRFAVWSLPDLRKIADQPLPGANGPIFSPDGKYLIVPAAEGAKVWRTQPWRPAGELSFQGRLGPFSFDGTNQLLAALVTYTPEDRDAEYSTRVWDLGSGAQIAHITMDRPSQSITISPDHNYLLADQVYFLQPSQLIDQICKRVGSNLAPQEWTRETGGTKYVPTCPTRPVPGEMSGN